MENFDQLRKNIELLEDPVIFNPFRTDVNLSACCLAAQPTLQDGKQLNFDGVIATPRGDVKAISLTDTGASALAFVNSKFVKQHKLSTVFLSQPYNLRLANDKLTAPIVHLAQVRVKLGDHSKELWCLVISLGIFDLILEMPWLEQHDPKTSFKSRFLTFDFDYCMTIVCTKTQSLFKAIKDQRTKN